MFNFFSLHTLLNQFLPGSVISGMVALSIFIYYGSMGAIYGINFIKEKKQA